MGRGAIDPEYFRRLEVCGNEFLQIASYQGINLNIRLIQAMYLSAMET
jgi:hypothetical protein